MGRMRYVGVDVHKNFCQFAMMDDAGHIVEEDRFPNHDEGIQSFISRLVGYDDVRVVMESTGSLWMKLYDVIEEHGLEAVLSNPYKTRLIAEARIKTDKLDARILAHLLRADLIPRCYVPSKDVREVRSLVRHRAKLSKTRTEIKNRIHALLDKHRLKAPCGELFSKEGLEWLKGLKLSSVDDAVLKSDLGILRALDEQVGYVESKIASVALKDANVELLITMPGIDFYSAMVLSSEMGSVERFSTDKKLVAWAGMAPSLRQSGDVLRVGRITKEGNKMVRWIMVQAALNAIRSDARLRAFYERYRSRKGHHKAIVAVAHEMLRIVWFMLKRGMPYRDENKRLSLRKHNRMSRIAMDG
jgi:transposase